MELISKDLVNLTSYYKLTKDEILLYRYMETLSYDGGIKIETDLDDSVLTVVGDFIIQALVLRYFDELSKSSEYRLWLRKHKLNDICSKLVK